MDKLFNKKSRVGLLSIVPAIFIVLLIFISAVNYRIQTDILGICSKYNVEEAVVREIESVSFRNMFIGYTALGLFVALLVLLYILEKLRSKKENKKLSDKINNLSILSMIKESSHNSSREIV